MAKYYGYEVRRVRVNGLRHGHSPDDRRQNRGRDPRGAPPIVYNRSGKVTDGNDRLLGARRKGQTHINAIYVPDSNIGGGCGLLLLATGGTAAVLGSSTWLALSGHLA
jgi:hypothetical protein